MKFELTLLSLISVVYGAKYAAYPPLNNPAYYSTHSKGDLLPLSCTKRHIDTGEHLFNSAGEVIYSPFSHCKETGKPLEFAYGVDKLYECTLSLQDEDFHMLQLYLHRDVGWSCRIASLSGLPASGLEKREIEEGAETKGGTACGDGYIPLDLNVRGEVWESHVDLDPNMNVLFMMDAGEIITGTAFSASKNTTRIIIGDEITMRFNVQWKKPTWGEYSDVKIAWLGKDLWWIYIIAGLVTGTIAGLLGSYGRLGRKWKSVQIADKLE
ncbi:hypothetical protein DAMA08_018480 [Martiniozyma asiatica (nom. inval.)]|nr:hypothetical protein DAMA08_018480 [Martiniozyma asiatica]